MTETTSESVEGRRSGELMQGRQATHSNSKTKPGVFFRFAGALVRGLPTLIVLGILAALAYWGHVNDWNLPRFSEIAGSKVDAGVLWCDAHGVPEAECIACIADLMPKAELRGWCKQHGVHECVLHHPGLSQLKQTFEVTPEDLNRASRAISARPRTENDPTCKMHLRRIQFSSIEAVGEAGIDINLVDRGPVVETIQTTGEIVYDPTRVAKLSTRAAGTAWSVERIIGDQVQKGDVLALIDAAEVGQAKSLLLESLVQLELASKTNARLSGLGDTVVPGSKIEKANADRAAAEVEVQKSIEVLSNLGLPIALENILGRPIADLRAEIRFLGIPDSIRDSLESSQTSSNLIPVVAPRDGIVVQSDVVAGEVVDPGKPIFMVANTNQMWVLLRIRMEEAVRVVIGQTLLFRPDGSLETLAGKVTWISTGVDPQTRTIEIRGEIDNRDGRLRNETFGAGEIVLREESSAIIVPSSAIHWEGCCHIAFVRDKDYFKEGSFKVFHARSVRPGVTIGDDTEVIAGLLPGEVVVTTGSGILRAELLKGNLGAG